MKSFLVALLLWSAVGRASAGRAAAPPQESSQVPRTAPASVDAGDYIYISAQGPRDADGALPATFAAQARQALNNLKSVVESAGLTMDHVVYTTVYLTDINQYAEMNHAFGKAFGKIPPARAVLGVAALPDPPIEINAVAVRNISDRRAVYPPNFKSDESFSPGILTHDRLFVSAMPATCRHRQSFRRSCRSGGFRPRPNESHRGSRWPHARQHGFRESLFDVADPGRVMNHHYAQRFEFGNTPARATIEVSSLPNGAQIEYTGVAVRDLKERRAVRPKNMPPSPTASPCVFAGDTLYCSAKSGFIPGPNEGVYTSTTALQLLQTMRNQMDNLEEADMDFSQVVSTTVYLDNLADLPAFNEVYGKYFRGTLPAQTTLQQIAPTDRGPDKDGHYPDLEQVSLIAVRKGRGQ